MGRDLGRQAGQGVWGRGPQKSSEENFAGDMSQELRYNLGGPPTQ